MLFRISVALFLVLGVPFASFGQALKLQGRWLKTYDPSRSLAEEWLAFETNGALSIGNKDGVFLRCSYDGNRETITAICDVGGERVKMDLTVAKEFEDLTNPAGAVYSKIAPEPKIERDTTVKAGTGDDSSPSSKKIAAAPLHKEEAAGRSGNIGKPVSDGARVASRTAIEPAPPKQTTTDAAPSNKTRISSVPVIDQEGGAKTKNDENAPRIAANPAARPVIKAASVSRIEIHEGTTHNQIHNLTEDVVALLPVEMREFLKPDMDILYSYSEFKVTTDFWKKTVIRRDNFIKKCNKIPLTTADALADDLGETIKYVLDIALSASTPDPFNEVLRNATLDFLDKGKLATYEIDYPGFETVSIDKAVDNLYELRKYDKKTVYPEMVKAIADIWTAIWIKNGGRYTAQPHKIVRRP